jgi:iron complex transport system substrate-binding protein
MRAFTLLAAVLALFTLSCRTGEPDRRVPSPRVVTLSPALTKMVFDLGLGDHVVGVTSFCRLPEGETRQVVGNALAVRTEPILAVEPDLLLVQMELKHFEPLQRLRPNLRIEHFEIETLDDVAAAIQRVGKLLRREQLGISQSRAFREHLERTRAKTDSLSKRRVLFVSGYTEPLAAGKGTFLDEMIFLAGGENALGRRFDGWQRPSLEVMVTAAPEIVFCLCDSGQEVEAGAYWAELGMPGAKTSVVTLTDHDWTLPAAHLAEYTERLAQMIHPQLEDAASP